MSEALEIGTELVRLCNDGKDHEVVDRFYDEKIVSIEGQGTDEMPARMDGIEAIRGKHAWWYDNNEVHATKATGPFCGHREDQFAVIHEMDTTTKSTGERGQMREVALYTTKNGKIVQEEFLYQTG
ncbi:MAG: nuclear transport factor 2 family protein [Myxococcales bacterium]|nr:nuclear transport factor 2 family protein [Myxococcales bacterium]